MLSNILLTPFDQEMRRKGYQLTRYADDWVVTCESAAEARAAVAAALRILNELGVQLHPQKTRIVHVRQGFDFLGYKIKRGKQLRLPPGKIRSGAQSGALYAFPREKSIRRFMDQVRALTGRRVPLRTKECHSYCISLRPGHETSGTHTYRQAYDPAFSLADVLLGVRIGIGLGPYRHVHEAGRVEPMSAPYPG